MPARYQPSPAERVASRPCCRSRGVSATGTNAIMATTSTTGATTVDGAVLAVTAAARTANLRMNAAWSWANRERIRGKPEQAVDPDYR